MQREVSAGRRVRRRLAPLWRSDPLLGTAVVAVAVIVLLAFAVLYVRPPNKQTITFETTDASAIAAGQDVRVVGISVGKVSDISIGQNTVTVRARIDDSIFVGDKTKVEVRMLTPVGGYAVSLIPMGDDRAGGGVIPAERVSVPYSIGDVLQSAPTVTDQVDAGTMHENLDELARALQGNTTSLRTIVDGMNSVAGVFDRQRDQIHQIAAMAAEYLQRFNTNRQFIFELVGKIDTVLATYDNNSAGFNYAYELLGSALSRLRPFEEFYLDHSDLVRTHIYNFRDTIAEFRENMAPAIDNLLAMRTELEKWLTPEGMTQFGGGTLSVAQLCVPIAGREC